MNKSDAIKNKNLLDFKGCHQESKQVTYGENVYKSDMTFLYRII